MLVRQLLQPRYRLWRRFWNGLCISWLQAENGQHLTDVRSSGILEPTLLTHFDSRSHAIRLLFMGDNCTLWNPFSIIPFSQLSHDLSCFNPILPLKITSLGVAWRQFTFTYKPGIFMCSLTLVLTAIVPQFITCLLLVLQSLLVEIANSSGNCCNRFYGSN